MKTIVFIDGVCPKPYTGHTLQTQGLGGSEASLVRVAEGLSTHYDVVVVQHNRVNSETYLGVTYQSAVPAHADFVVVLRAQALIPAVRKTFPEAKVFLWLTDLPQTALMYGAQALSDNKVTLIGVSKFHENGIKDMIMRGQPTGPLRVIHIYNPVDDTLVSDNTPTNPNKMVFFSAPIKGLEHTLDMFAQLRRAGGALAKMELYIANPGYMADRDTLGLEGIINLGSLPHADIIKHVREAFCVFTCNNKFPETFGLVFAEAQAVGTPFLAHPLGAIRETSSHPSQLVDTTDIRAIANTLTRWAIETPKVSLDPKFRLQNVLKEWHNILK
jgi:glycosyltransferase involved in cell wall biosynthesis